MRFALNTLAVASLITAGLTALPAPARAADDLNRVAEAICTFATANDRGSLRKKLDAADLDLRRVYGGITCNGMSLLRATTLAGALDAATFIATKLGKNNLQKPEADGLNILQWTEKQMAGGDAALKAKLQPLLDLYKTEPQ